MNWIKNFFSGPEFFQLDHQKEYQLQELIEILKCEHISVGTGNTIVLKILDELVKKHEK